MITIKTGTNTYCIWMNPVLYPLNLVCGIVKGLGEAAQVLTKALCLASDVSR